jgi:hypothetical protein
VIIQCHTDQKDAFLLRVIGPTFRALAAAAVIYMLGLACGSADEGGSSVALSADSSDSLRIELVGVDSISVLDLLRRGHEVAIKHSAMGVFVTGIDSFENSTEAFWLYSVNDTMPQVGCDEVITRTGDRIVWHYRKFE